MTKMLMVMMIVIRMFCSLLMMLMTRIENINVLLVRSPRAEWSDVKSYGSYE